MEDFTLKPYVENYPEELKQLKAEVFGLDLTIEAVSKDDPLGALQNLINQRDRAKERITEINSILNSK